MITIDIKNQQAVEGDVTHEITTRTKQTKSGTERTRLMFKDNAGFIRTVSEGTTEIKVTQGIKGFSWLAAVPEDKFQPIYDQLITLFNQYGGLTTTLSNDDLEKKILRERAKLDKLMALLNLSK